MSTKKRTPMLTKRFEVLETFYETAKASPDANEDRLVVTDDFAAVIDGATSSGKLDGVAGGIVAAEAVAETIRALPADASAQDFVALATGRLAERIGPLDPSRPPPSAAAVVYSGARREIWRVGDCHFRIDDAEFLGDKPLDLLAYGFRCAVLRAELALGLTSIEAERARPTLEQAFRPLILAQHAYANLAADDPLAYGSLNGKPVPAKFIEIRSCGEAREIVLCSDGFPRPYAKLSEGLQALATLREDDPLLVREYLGSRPFPETSAFFDDATYLRLRPRNTRIFDD